MLSSYDLGDTTIIMQTGQWGDTEQGIVLVLKWVE
jgi:hypothetical protein